MHTPAPWTLAAGHSNRVLLINDARGHAVGEYVDTRNPEDARLIAAAPDLLDASIELVTKLEKLAIHESYYRQMKEAIFKAIGSNKP